MKRAGELFPQCLLINFLPASVRDGLGNPKGSAVAGQIIKTLRERRPRRD